MRRQLKIIAAVSLACVPMVAHAAAFDVEQASRAWLDTLQGPARAKSDAYFEGGYWLPLWGTLASVISDMLLLKLRLSARFRDIPQIVMSIMQFSMFMTPVFWQPGERVGLMDAVLDIVEIFMDFAGHLLSVVVLGTLFFGGILAGMITEWAGRRWR